MNRKLAIFFIAAFLPTGFAVRGADPPPLVPLQGNLARVSPSDPNRFVALPDGRYDILVTLYTAPIGGASRVWGPERHQNMVVTDGIFNLMLGTIIGFESELSADPAFFGQPLYAGVTVDADGDPATADLEISPRVRLLPRLHASRAKDVDRLSGIPSDVFATDAERDAKIQDLLDQISNVQQPIHLLRVEQGFSVNVGDAVTLKENGAIRPGFEPLGPQILGVPQNVDTQQISGLAAVLLSDRKFALARSTGSVSVGTLDAGTITYGPEAPFAVSVGDFDLVSLSPTQIVVVYSDAATLAFPYARAGTISPTDEITFGAPVELNALASGSVAAAVVGPNKVVAVYHRSAVGPAVSASTSAKLGIVSGNTIAFESSSRSVSGNFIRRGFVAVSPSPDTVLVAYSNDNANDNGEVRFAVAGETALGSFSNFETFDFAGINAISAAPIAPNRTVIVYSDGSLPGGRALAVVIAIENNTMFRSNPVEIAEFTPRSTSIALMSDGRVAIGLSDLSSLSRGVLEIRSVRGFAFSFVSTFEFDSDPVPTAQVLAFPTTELLIAYAKTVQINVEQAFTVTTGRFNELDFPPLGVVRTAAGPGQTAEVIVTGISDVHSGLVPGAVYGMNTDGSLGTTHSNPRIGLAISPTELVLRFD